MKSLYQVILEGGAGGHMLHPYQLPWVKNGKSLIQFYDIAAKNIKDLDASIKIDGVNVSVRMMDGDFVFDRMSPKDIEGIRKDQLAERFPAGHGLIKMGGLVLDIFNDSIDSCKTELQQLGLYDDETILLNIEYVDRNTNLISYPCSFLAIHGLLKYEINGNKRTTHEISYDKDVLSRYITKLNKISSKYGFEVIGSVEAKVVRKPNIQKVLQSELTINETGEPVTKTLEEWLKNVNEFDISKTAATFSGKRIGVISNEAYRYCSNTDAPISSMFKKPDVIPNIINCFIIFRANVLLGDEILSCIDSKLGSGNDNEGIVVRNAKITKIDAPVKITGSFTVNIVNSRFVK